MMRTGPGARSHQPHMGQRPAKLAEQGAPTAQKSSRATAICLAQSSRNIDDRFPRHIFMHLATLQYHVCFLRMLQRTMRLLPVKRKHLQRPRSSDMILSLTSPALCDPHFAAHRRLSNVGQCKKAETIQLQRYRSKGTEKTCGSAHF